MSTDMGVHLKPINLGKRKEAEKLVYDVMDALDPSGVNTKKYRDMFAGMTNAEFKKFMEQIWLDDNFNFMLDVVDYDRSLKLENIEKAAKIIGIPLEEHIIMPFSNMDLENPVVSKEKFITMYIIDKRMQQTTQKKNSTSIHISERSAITNQAINDDKNGRESDVENMALIARGAINNARELNGFRADGMQRKTKAYYDATTKGSISLEEVESVAGIDDRTTLNTIDVYYLGMGIKTDLVDESLVLSKTLKNL